MSSKNLFILPPGLYRGANVAEIQATVNGLREMDLFHLPYERDVYIQMPWSDCISHQGKHVPDNPSCIVLIGPYGNSEGVVAKIINKQTGAECDLVHEARLRDQKVEVESLISMAAALLIVMLATRNVVKHTKQNKLAKLGIGKKKWHSQFEYTTTISLPDELDDDTDHPATGAAKAPHLRRGHIRRQHYGPGFAYVKKIWVAPVFVNADPDFVNRRGAYNVVTHEHCAA